MPSSTLPVAPLTPSERRKRWRERNRHLSKERVVILPTEANEALLKIAGNTNLSPSAVLLAGLHGVATLSSEHLIELANEAALHFGKSLLGKPQPSVSKTASQAQGRRK